MRVTIQKGKSSRTERIIHEILKEERIPFKYKWMIGGMECDFVIGKYVIEVDGHPQNPEKNKKLVSLGYSPIHYQNNEVVENKENIRELIRKCQEQVLRRGEQTPTGM